MMRLFSYGIFMSPFNRRYYGIDSQAHYDTVIGYATVGSGIVQAVPDERYTLTGMVFTVPDEAWPELDRLEYGYERITVTTTHGYEAQMYVKPGCRKPAIKPRFRLETIGIESLMGQLKQTTRGRKHGRANQAKVKCCTCD